ncbi:glycoside hydrolase family 6 protein [Agromyces sp. MMS24-JH15]|uniref:glycoside hydrolase family 6 protein n=1 Tax=Agromyces sp. MMS24-JH15 TaxID=3243765 RepID=UPI0037491CE9
MADDARDDASATRHRRDDSRYVVRTGTAGGAGGTGPSDVPGDVPGEHAARPDDPAAGAAAGSTEPPRTGPSARIGAPTRAADTGPSIRRGPRRTPDVREASTPRPNRAWWTTTLIILLAAALLIPIGVWLASSIEPEQGGALYGGRDLFVDPGSSPAVAADAAVDTDERHAAEVISARPMAVWLTPEEFPPGTVGDEVRDIVAQATDAAAVPSFVIYGMPGRDCQGQSAGGLATQAEYVRWVEEITAGLSGRQAIIVLEPDSLALGPSCGDTARRTELISAAVGSLQNSTASVYLDGGHSNWLAPREMADLLEAAGVAHARGFATNVSNMRTTDSELTYAHRVADELGGGAHAVVDVSRNGDGPAVDAEWCNPPGIALGEDPQKGPIDDVVDALLWIKTPGESDGECNGGPPAGEWWAEGAIELVENAGR